MSFLLHIQSFRFHLISHKLKVDSPEHVRILNGDAYEITGQAYHNTWTHQRRRRRKEKFGGGGAESEKNASCSSKSICDENPTTHSRNNTQDGMLKSDDVIGSSSNSEYKYKQSEFMKRKHEIEMKDDTMADTMHHKRVKLEKTTLDKAKQIQTLDYQEYSEIGNDVSKSQNNDVSKKEENDELDLLNESEEENPLFTFSCTVGVASQFHATGGRTPTLSMACLEGDRNQFHQLFLCLKNKLCGTVQV